MYIVCFVLLFAQFKNERNVLHSNRNSMLAINIAIKTNTNAITFELGIESVAVCVYIYRS